MKIAVLGGGPSGLYFAISAKLRDPRHDITVYERNKPDDTFGWGVVLSDETLDNLRTNDAKSADAIHAHFAYWDDVAVVHDGHRTLSTGHGFCGIGRMQMLLDLQSRALELGVKIEFETDVQDTRAYMNTHDLVVASDGIHSRTRSEFEEHFRPDIDVRKCHFVWLGTHQKFDDAFTFIFEKTQHGWIWAHAYQFDNDTATFIVECGPEVFEAFGFGEMDQDKCVSVCEEIFKNHLGGHRLMTNSRHIRGSAWMNFPRVLCENWHHENVVLLGDSSATAHFSIGSGSKLGMESAIALAEYITKEDSLAAAFEKYQEERRLDVLRLQSAARNSTEWFEQVERYLDLDSVQFNYALLTRSQRISHENLRMRDPKWLASAEAWFQEQAGADGSRSPKTPRAPMFAPYKLRDMDLVNRVVVSPMAQYKATDGSPRDWHLVHYGALAKGGAGLVYAEMTCVSADGRITPGCPGLYDDSHVTAWKRVTDFVHAESQAKMCCQIGHAGRKGSTKLGWEGTDVPLDDGNWDLIAPTAMAWDEDNATPKAMDRADMDRVTADFVASTKRALDAGFDMVELHAAHGYLISSFISPMSNHRTDEYGGNLENRMRYPLEVCRAMRGAWPEAKPMSVRISANDWVGDDGVTPEDAVQIARMFHEAGVDIIDVSTGQTSTEASPVYGRMYQVPFSDRIKNELGIATMAVGNIYEPDHANSVLMAGRADLVCLARPHLANPYWTLHAAAALQSVGAAGDESSQWPKPYLAGADQMKRLSERGDGPGIRIESQNK